MDITTLTSLINTFRAETKQDSITPDSLGQLLQKIVNVLEQASDTATLQLIVISASRPVTLRRDAGTDYYLPKEKVNKEHRQA